MNSFAKSLTLYALLAVAYGVDFAWKDCGGSMVHFNKLNITPLPLVVSKTNKIYLTSNVSLNQDLPLAAEFDLQINKSLIIEGKNFPITIPCVDGLGSCQMKVCDMFHLWYSDLLCPFFKSAGHTCACPVKAGTFVGDHIGVTVPLDKFHGLAAQLADGDYSIRFTITDPAKTHMYACLDLQAHLTFQH